MPSQPHVCVFCGSSRGRRPRYADAARQVGTALAQQGIGLVYGGGRVGLMGILADAALEAGGRVVGVIPASLDRKELTHRGVTELHIVGGMHERKALMAEKSDGFLMLPGGVGTLEEFFEVLTWAALGLHRKPIGILNVDGYFDPLLELLDHIAGERFVRSRYLEVLLISDRPEELATRLLDHVPPQISPRWIDPDET
jgi:uncharacterized protein (TIGR00730 family)